ncbi:MAG: DnaA regulatory inactivator Hda [Rhodocyclaceae bacterium]|nr:DnaA regulatory inactivator Hda [Rhodocyclaceae bacterium]
MRQIPLDIRPAPVADFANFVPGANAELVERLCHLATPLAFDALYIWGELGSGRSHLLQATAAAAGRPVTAWRGAEVGEDLPLPPGGLLIVDEVDRLSPEGQIALFRAFNTARLVGLALLMAGDAPPLHLALREDLRTRIGQALIYQVQPLSDEEKAETLARHARARGMRLEPEVITYLLRHGRRDLGSLFAVLEELDEQTLIRKRSASVALVKEILAGREETAGSP